MARRSTLETILGKLNNEMGNVATPSYGIGARDNLIATLQRTQQFLWEDYDWPFLKIKKNIQLQAGSYRYDIPDEMASDRITRVQVKYTNNWQDVQYRIEEDELFTIHDSDLDQRNDPVRRWDYYYDTDNDAEQIEVWPIPATNFDATTLNGALKITGIKTLSDFVSESDRADLDDNLIVLFAAAELLARDRSDDAAIKQDKAERLYTKLKSNAGVAKSFQIGGDDIEDATPRTRIRAVYGNFSGA